MNFHLNGVKFYGRNGKTVSSLDVESSATELDEEISNRELLFREDRNPSHSVDIHKEQSAKINLRQYFPDSLLNCNASLIDSTFNASIDVQYGPAIYTSSGQDTLENPVMHRLKKTRKRSRQESDYKSKTESVSKTDRKDLRKKLSAKRKCCLPKNTSEKPSPHRKEQSETKLLVFNFNSHSTLKKVKKQLIPESDSETESVKSVHNEKIKDSRKKKFSKHNYPLDKPAYKAEKKPPCPHADKQRMKVAETKFQDQFVLPDNIKRISCSINFPCVGLDHVYEIQRLNPLEDVIFYCELCNARCVQNTIISHLKSFKHHLRCLKIHNRGLYTKYKYKKKSVICKTVEKHIKFFEKKCGRGTITLKPSGYHLRQRIPSDSSSDESYYSERNSKQYSVKTYSRTSTTFQITTPHPNILSSSPNKQHQNAMPSNFSESYDWCFETNQKQESAYSKPDMSKGDFKCRLCDCHMSSDVVWDSHIVGKRHRKNLKKLPWERPSKVKTVKYHNRISRLYDDLECLEEDPGPIIGLDYITEIAKSDSNLGSTYNCHLCNGCFTKLNVVDHLCTSKHKLKYIKEVDPRTYDLLITGTYSLTSLENMTENVASELQERFGSGKVEVRVEI